MKKKVIMLIIIVIISGCSSSDNKLSKDEQFFADRIEIDGMSIFLDKLEDAGYDSEHDGVPSCPVFYGSGKYFDITEEDRIIVFEYTKAERFRKDRYSISSDGFTVTESLGETSTSTTNYSWIARPNFYLDNNLLIQYIGDNAEIIEFLDNNCEMRIAGY